MSLKTELHAWFKKTTRSKEQEVLEARELLKKYSYAVYELENRVQQLDTQVGALTQAIKDREGA